MKDLVEKRLRELVALQTAEIPHVGETSATLRKSMEYSLLAGGKRLRPVMLLQTGRMLGVPTEEMLDTACAVEMIHTYSLIHDDLPGMDNDTMRRGKPTNHVVFGEGNAILAGDGLLNYAFECMLTTAQRYPEHASRHIQAISEIARGSGVYGMVGGQSFDLASETNGSEELLSFIDYAKTACMFIYPMRAAVRLAGGTEETLEAVEAYGRYFGEMFQVWDDVLDHRGNAEKLGKSIGKDANADKLTAVSKYGLEGAEAYAAILGDKAKQSIRRIDADVSYFIDLIDVMLKREN